jgi:hypothetical protein
LPSCVLFWLFFAFVLFVVCRCIFVTIVHVPSVLDFPAHSWPTIRTWTAPSVASFGYHYPQYWWLAEIVILPVIKTWPYMWGCEQINKCLYSLCLFSVISIKIFKFVINKNAKIKNFDQTCNTFLFIFFHSHTHFIIKDCNKTRTHLNSVLLLVNNYLFLIIFRSFLHLRISEEAEIGRNLLIIIIWRLAFLPFANIYFCKFSFEICNS